MGKQTMIWKRRGIGKEEGGKKNDWEKERGSGNRIWKGKGETGGRRKRNSEGPEQHLKSSL
jgi:hypothetical protein